MRKFLITIGIGVCLAAMQSKAQSCCGNPSLSTSGENILNFTTLSKKKVVIELNSDFTQLKSNTHTDISTNSGHDHHNHSTTTNNMNEHTSLKSISINTAQIRYGLHDKLTLHAQVPLWFISASDKHTFILGDIPLLATYKLSQKENYGVGAIAGVELPTGNNYVVFENNYLITGSGSFDPLLGMSFWFKYKKFLTRVQTQYKQGMKGYDDIHFGSTLNSQWIVAYYLKGIDTESKFKLNLNTGLNQDWTNAHSLNGKFMDNTGSFILWYNAGMQIQYKKWLFPISFIIPVHTQMRGMQNEPQFRMKTGVTLLIN